MQNKSIKEKRAFVVAIIFSLWVLGLQLLTVIGGETDDTYFLMIGNAPDFTYIQWIQNMWFGWSSRLIINCLCVFFTVIPYMIWRIINAVLIAAVPFLLWKMADVKFADRESTAVLACALFMIIPYIITGEAGWIATSVNYVLPATCLLVCIYLLWKTAHEKPVSIWERIGYFAAACVATDSEQGAFCMLVAFMVFSFWMLLAKKRGHRIEVFAITLFSLLRMAMVFFCPGNIIRKGLVIKENYPEFGKMNIFNKLLAGIYSVASDMFLVFFAMTFTMLLLIIILVWKKHKVWYKRLISAIPLACNILVPAAVLTLVYRDYATAVTGRTWSSSVKNVLVILGISGNTNFLWNTLPAVLYGLIVCVFGCIFLSIWWVIEGSKRYVTELTFFVGCCTKGAMGFTGTVWFSHSRTGYYMILAEMFVILQLYGKWKQMENSCLQKLYLYFTIFLACLNSVVSYSTVILYAKA